VDGTLAFNSPIYGQGPESERERLIRQRMMNMRGRSGGTSHEAATVTVSATVKADFPLPADASPEELLIAARELEDKIRAAIAAPASEKKELSAEEQELMEEMQIQMEMMGETPSAGGAQFAYVSQLSQQEQAAVHAEAMELARSHATNLATAAGGAAGNVLSITVAGSESSRMYEACMESLGQRASRPALTPGEAIGTQPLSVIYSVNLSVTFELRQ
jgi:hypothetical protein